MSTATRTHRTAAGSPIRRPRTRRPRGARVAAVLGCAVAGLVALLVVRPGWFGLSDVSGFLHLVSFPLLLGIGWLGVGLVLGLLAAATRRRFVAALSVVALLAGAASALTAAGRGFGGEPPPVAGQHTTVLTFNTLGGAVSPDRLAGLLARNRVDAAALQETPASFAREVAAAAARHGRPMQVLGGEQSPMPVAATSLLVADTWGRYRLVGLPDTGLGAVLAEPVRGSGPTIAAVHSPPPPVPTVVLGRPSVWRAGAASAVDLCRTGAADVVAGDVNATLDHAPLADLGGCVDVAAATGAGAEGTWPARVPTPFAAVIDHVFVDAAEFQPLSTGVARISGSDHRALVVAVRPR